MRCIRLNNNDDLNALLTLNTLKGPNIIKNYPLHKKWMDKAIRDIKIGNRIAFGVFESTELVGSVIMKFGFTQDLELKNFIVKSDVNDNVKFSNRVRKSLIEQIVRFCQKNRFESCSIDIITDDLSEINFFLKEGFRVVNLKESTVKNAPNTYSLTRRIDAVYNDDPLDFLKMINWILTNKYKFSINPTINSIDLSDCCLSFDRIEFEVENYHLPNEYKILGEVLIDELSLISVSMDRLEEISKLYSETSDIKLFFSFTKNSKMDSLGIRAFDFTDVLTLLGSNSNAFKIPFDSSDIGGIIYFLDERFENLIKEHQGKLFNNSSFLLYLTDGYGSSLETDQFVLFCKYNIFEQDVKLWGISYIESLKHGSYNEIYEKFRQNTDFIKSTFGDYDDLYSDEDWNYYTSYLQNISSENTLVNDITVLKLSPFRLLKDKKAINNIFDDQIKDYIKNELREHIVESIYIDKRSVNQIINSISKKDFVKNSITIEDYSNPRIFISYSHNDKDIATELKDILNDEGYETIFDKEYLQTGNEIKTFIENSIKETNITLTIISKNSLTSSWVAIETLTSMYTEKIIGRKLFPCIIDVDFFNDKNFTDKLLDVVDKEIEFYNSKILIRVKKNSGCDDLNSELKRLKTLRTELPNIIEKIKSADYIDLTNDYDLGIKQLLDNLKKKINSISDEKSDYKIE